MSSNHRFLSLDVFRGIAIAGMILVNTPGSWNYVYRPFDHAAWNGLTPTDLVFPFFMFIMGMSIFISMRKTHFIFSVALAKKIIVRSILIFLIGLIINWAAIGAYSYHQIAVPENALFKNLFITFSDFSHLRILGVLQRLAMCYAVVSFFCFFIKQRAIPAIVIIGLVIYFTLLMLGNGFEQSENNLIAIIDRHIFGAAHIYKENGISFDPEGLLSTLPSILHTFIGFYCGQFLFNQQNKENSALMLFVIGTSLLFIGFLISFGCPINKKIWSPSYVFVTCGISAQFLALLIWIIDIKHRSFGNRFFAVFGVNPLFCYILSAFLTTIIFDTVFITNGLSIHAILYDRILQPFIGNHSGSLIYAAICVFIIWLICDPLYKKHIYIKL